jgi:hypothetical protein
MREHSIYREHEFKTRFSLEQALISQLEYLMGSIGWLRNWRVKNTNNSLDEGFDFEVTLTLPEGKALLAIQCKKELRPSAFHSIVHGFSRRKRPLIPVLAMPFVSSGLSDLCAMHHWSWFDLAGNCHIDVPGAIYLERLGHDPIYARPKPSANLGTPEAGRVIRAILAPENVGRRWTQRRMAIHFGQWDMPEASLGLVNKIVQHFRDEAFIEALPQRGFKLVDPVRLLFAWRDAYRFNRHEKRSYFSLLQGKQLQDALAKFDQEVNGFAAYAAFSAADFQAAHVRQPKTWIYVSDRYIKRFEELIKAKRVDSGENLVVLVPSDPGVFYLREVSSARNMQLGRTNPVQTYVDLYHCGGRGREASEALLEQRLKPAWQNHKLI